MRFWQQSATSWGAAAKRSGGRMTGVDWPNLVTMFFDQADRLGERPFLWAKHEGQYRPMSWRQVAAGASEFARGLKAIGVGQGDRIMLVAESRPEWLIADLAIMAAGAITVPAYTTNTEADHLHILENSGAKGAIVSTHKLAGPLLAAANRSADAAFVITIEPPDTHHQPGVEVIAWEEVIARGQHDHTNVVEAAAKLSRTDSACIIYTSGTGGAPKGVLLHHGAILHNCAAALEALEELGLGDEVFLSFLPLSHAYEHTAGQFFPIFIGAQIYYAEGLDRLSANLIEARPTIMTAVPRLYEVLHQRITLGVRKAGGRKEKLFRFALNVGVRRYQGNLGLGDRLVDPLLDRFVRDKVRARFGGRLKALVSGGGPLNTEIGMFFTALGLCILQGYGLTESAPLITLNRPNKVKIDTVGPPVKDTEVRIADDGEILARGELVMQGYWRNEPATREAIRDGWLYTGDIGEIDEDGYIRITDRKKDIIVNSGGDNLSPARIEGTLTLRREIAQAMVYGDGRPHVVALLVPEMEWAREWARSAGKAANLATLADDGDFRKALGKAVDEVNRSLSIIQKVRKFIIVAKPFTIENGQLTPTMKLRRHVIRQAYGTPLDALYS